LRLLDGCYLGKLSIFYKALPSYLLFLELAALSFPWGLLLAPAQFPIDLNY
jgi:hypothetical protein